MTQQITINPATFDGAKFAAQYGLTRFQYRVINGTTLVYPDGLPAPGDLVIPQVDPIGVFKPISTKYFKSTDATPVAAFSFTLPTSSALLLKLDVMATDLTNVAYYEHRGVIKRGGGNAVLVGFANAFPPVEDVGGWNSIITVSGANAVWQITGQVGAAIHWTLDGVCKLVNPS